jgi:hypothetical protein
LVLADPLGAVVVVVADQLGAVAVVVADPLGAVVVVVADQLGAVVVVAADLLGGWWWRIRHWWCCRRRWWRCFAVVFRVYGLSAHRPNAIITTCRCGYNGSKTLHELVECSS